MTPRRLVRLEYYFLTWPQNLQPSTAPKLLTPIDVSVFSVFLLLGHDPCPILHPDTMHSHHRPLGSSGMLHTWGCNMSCRGQGAYQLSPLILVWPANTGFLSSSSQLPPPCNAQRYGGSNSLCLITALSHQISF